VYAVVRICFNFFMIYIDDPKKCRFWVEDIDPKPNNCHHIKADGSISIHYCPAINFHNCRSFIPKEEK